MKHLIFAFIFIILGLGQESAYAQNNPDTSSNPSYSSVKEPELETHHEPNEKPTDENETDGNSLPFIEDSDMGGNEIPELSTTDKIAKKGNLWSMLQTFSGIGTLILAGIATCYARGAFLTGKAVVKEARKTTKAAIDTLASDRAWLVMGEGVNNFIQGGQIVEIDETVSNFTQGIATNIGIFNSGRTPAIEVEMTHRDWKGDGEPPNSFFVVDEPNRENATMMIGPERGIHTADKLIVDDQMKQWFNREIRWFVYSQATFKTIRSDEVQYVQIAMEVRPASTNFMDAANTPHSIIIEPRMQKIGTLDKNDNN